MLGAPSAGIFLLGIFTRRGNAPGALTGLVLAVAGLLAARMLGFDLYFNGIIAVTGTVVAGYLASLAFPRGNRSDAGLTFHSLRSKNAGGEAGVG
jgi:SSS family solute:Na+ symporter